MKVLFACSELYPLVKTGGLADVASNLPQALHRLGHDVRIVLPAYRPVKEKLADTSRLFSLQVREHGVSLLSAGAPGSSIPLYLVDCPALFDREGGPYGHYSDQGWPDNAERFGVFNQVIAELVLNENRLSWRPDILHCHDWQTGLAVALVSQQAERPATVFTIHNLAYQGLFPAETFRKLALPAALWDFRALEFYGQLSFIKGGIAFADAVNTVSPGYAREILTEGYGCGLDGLLRHRGKAFCGIVNGIDTDVWNPATDKAIAEPYSKDSLENRKASRVSLLQHFGMEGDNTLVVGVLSRLTEQKGIDLVMQALPALQQLPVKLVILGSGEPGYENALAAWAGEHPDFIGLHIGYDETLAHRLIAGVDVLLIPSRYEPCGLTQLYSQRYGAVPVARQTGGLADTIVDSEISGERSKATGFLFQDYTVGALVAAVERAVAAFHKPLQWRTLQLNGMSRDFSWQASAILYAELYQSVIRSVDSHQSTFDVSQ